MHIYSNIGKCQFRYRFLSAYQGNCYLLISIKGKDRKFKLMQGSFRHSSSLAHRISKSTIYLHVIQICFPVSIQLVPCFSRMQFQVLVFLINIFYSFSLTNGITQLELFPGLKCSYNYDLEVHTHRGKRSTKELNFKINAQVCSLQNPFIYK